MDARDFIQNLTDATFDGHVRNDEGLTIVRVTATIPNWGEQVAYFSKESAQRCISELTRLVETL